MNCIYCNKTVISQNPITVTGLGPAHQSCYNKEMFNRRIFKGLSIKSLDDDELVELEDMIKMELNTRMDRNVVDLF